MPHSTDRITHTTAFVSYTSRGALAETRNSSMGPPHEGSIRRPIAPWANTLTTELHLALRVVLTTKSHTHKITHTQNRTHTIAHKFTQNTHTNTLLPFPALWSLLFLSAPQNTTRLWSEGFEWDRYPACWEAPVPCSSVWNRAKQTYNFYSNAL